MYFFVVLCRTFSDVLRLSLVLGVFYWYYVFRSLEMTYFPGVKRVTDPLTFVLIHSWIVFITGCAGLWFSSKGFT
jgi:hypothetical protein